MELPFLPKALEVVKQNFRHHQDSLEKGRAEGHWDHWGDDFAPKNMDDCGLLRVQPRPPDIVCSCIFPHVSYDVLPYVAKFNWITIIGMGSKFDPC